MASPAGWSVVEMPGDRAAVSSFTGTEDGVDLLLVGASVRYLAGWFIEAGYRPLALDLFADRDLQALCPAKSIAREDWPDGLYEACEPYRGLPIVYAGGLENAPKLLEKLAKNHPLWGNRARVLGPARDLAQWTAILTEGGFQVPEWIPGPVGLQDDGKSSEVASEKARTIPEGNWLFKPYRGAGGLNIKDAPLGKTIPAGYFAQRKIKGTGVSLSFSLGPGEPRFFLGAYEMPMIPALASPAFAYRGSVVYRGMTLVMNAQGKALAHILKDKMGLRGLVGVDAISVDGHLRILEINPRPTASMELADFGGGSALARWHVAAFLGANHALENTLPREKPLAKAIWYADRNFRFPKEFAQEEIEKDLKIQLADIPPGWQPMVEGEPILTIVLEESDPGRMIERIEAAVAFLKKRLFPSS